MNVTTQQAAELLGVTRQSVARYISGGKLNARRHGLKVFVIKLDELRDFARRNNLVFNDSLAQQFEQK